MYQFLNVEGMQVRAKLDPCSVYTILNKIPQGAQLGDRIDIHPENENESGVGNLIQGQITINNKLTEGQIVFIPHYPENIIGLIQIFNLDMISITMKKKCVNVTPVMITGNNPKKLRQPYLNKALMNRASSVLKRWEMQGIIERDRSPCNSPIYLDKCHNGKFTILFNFHKLNECSEAIPAKEMNRNNSIANIALGKYYSFIKLHEGQWHIPLDKATKYKTAFTFRRTQYVWNRLPQGFKNTSIILHKSLGHILDKLPAEIRSRVTYYVDVILISGDTEADCHKFTAELKCHLEDHGFEIHRESLIACTPVLEFLGKEIHPEGIKLGRTYLQKVRNVKSPQSLLQLKQLLGLLTDAAKHTPRFSIMCKDLNVLLRKGNQWIWGAKEQTALRTLQQKILDNRMLVNGLHDGEKCTVQMSVHGEEWEAEILNSKMKPYQFDSGICDSNKYEQNIGIQELTAMSRVWKNYKSLLKDREIKWRVTSPLVAQYQTNPESLCVNKNTDLAFLFSSNHKIIVQPPTAQL
ncbi:uncharacterized protein LOC105947003 [Xenopus tropicalis]|uniref:ribonuclease H n=1 Tax=Xenopus tropicalis TaxID=8364 RepID=A0A8J0SKX2_XENTR|nr:uncharacterized protein LOC105947003 [Xenopus tropicalis]|eukprot:XP_012817066.1 PREDICTED: uncharacterized protein LOC105947003 [Xenopus tropicalis]